MAMLDEVLTIGFESDTAWPEEIKNAQYVKLVGGDPLFDPHTKTITVSVGSGTATNVTSSADGTVNSYPSGQRRLLSSTGSTPGGSWDVANKTLLDSAIEANALALTKLHGGAATNGQYLSFNTSSGYWEPATLPTVPVAATATPLVESGAGSVGSSAKYAKEDHVHPAVAGVSPATATPLVESGSGSVGVSAKYAREDHVHPAAGGEASPSSDTAPKGPSSLGTVGTEGAWSHGDHRHEDEIHPSCIVEIPEAVNISAPGFLIYNGQELSGERVFVNDPNTVINNGPWEFNGPAAPMTRPSDWTGEKDWSFQHVFPIRNMTGSSEVGVLNGQPSYGYAIVTGKPWRSTITVGTHNVPFFRVGCPIPSVVFHKPCFCAAICDIPDLSDVDNTGELFDGCTLTNGMRVFLPLQTTDPASKGIYTVVVGATVSLSRADILDGSTHSGTVAHEITVLNGDRWGAGHRWHYSIDGEVGVAVPSVVSLSGRSVVYGQIPASESNTTIWSAPQWSDRNRTAIRVRGKITIDPDTYEDWASTYYAWEIYDQSALAAAAPTDEGGRTWETRINVGTSVTLQATTGQAPPGGSGCWYLQVNSNDSTQVGEGWAYLSLAGGYRYRIRVKAKESVAGMICLSSTYSSLNYDNSYPLTTSWESQDFSEDRPSNSYLIVHTRETVYTQTASITYFAHLQIDRRKLYVDPINNANIDFQYTALGADWTNSTAGAVSTKGHIMASSISGTVYMPYKGFARNVDLVIDHQGYSLLDDTTVTDPVSQTSPLDYPWD